MGVIPVGTTLRLNNYPVVTISLIAINCFVYIPWILFYEEYLYSPDYIAHVEYLISFFSVFLHANLYHLFGNMFFLWLFGSYLEDKIGGKKFLFYYFICDIGSRVLHLALSGESGIGASGAISGIMGMYLIRCHYSKIKTIVPVLLWYIKVNINAVWLLLIFILWDFYDALYVDDNIANWAHLGGYFTGLVVGMLNHYWKVAKVEDLYDRAAESMRIKSGINDAERDLIEIIKIDPDNADAHLQLARYYSGHSQKKDKGKKHYLAAARIYLWKNNFLSMAGEIFTEYLFIYNEPQEPALHLKYADTLSNVANYSGAVKILEPVIQRDVLKGVIGEKILFNYITFCLKAELKEPAQNALEMYKHIYPDSSQGKKVEALINSYKPGIRKKVIVEYTPETSRLEKVIEVFHQTVSDPLYWFVSLILINIFVGILFFESLFLGFLVTMGIRKVSSCIGGIYEGSNASEAERLREYHINTFLNKARVCERDENYDDAIEYLNAVLREDRKGEHHLGVRYQLARLCHKMANRPHEALQHYRALFKLAPDDHPFKRDAYHGMKELSRQSPPVALSCT
jgi:membrane associated rhomboid family serine protease